MSDNEFSKLGLGPEWIENLDNLEYTKMTPIQAAALPVMLAGHDVLGEASTGTGKTAAFGLALLQKIKPASRLVGGLVLCPTRELARQIAEEIRRLAWALPNTNVVTITGGESTSHQISAINNGIDVIVGTPGRILDLVEREILHLTRVETLVLDEADRMLEMGFIDDVAKIIDATRDRRQTLLFSATIDHEVREVSDRFQKQARYISVVDEEPDPDITQIVYDTGNLNRIDALRRVLEHHDPDSAVIFCNQKDTCDFVTEALRDKGYSARALHGGFEQRERDDVLILFANQSLRLLVATNVAARGIDISELDAVINYELPYEVDSYVHRIGRTGRAGEEGVAISLIDARERGRLARYDEELAAVTPGNAEDLPAEFEPPRSAPTQTIVIQGGRKDKLRPGDIVGAFTGDFEIPGDRIGNITIRDLVAFVAVDHEFAEAALTGVVEGTIKGRSFGGFMLD